MKKHIQHLAIAGALLMGVAQANAVPAKPGILRVANADGTELNVRLVGDEFFHQYYSEDGYPLMVVDGNFYYCDVTLSGDFVNSNIRATDKSMRDNAAKSFVANVNLNNLEARVKARADKMPRRKMVSDLKALPMNRAKAEGETPDGPPYERGYGLFSDSRFPAYGDQKAIVILVEYKDVKFSLEDPHDYFSRMLNETGFNDYGGTGCAKEYFTLNSDGAFNCDFDVFGPITLSKNMSYYGGNDWYGNDENPADMVKEACEQLDDTVDFSEYDRDGDGVVDNVFIFYAGRGEASGGSSDTVWPHSWNMASAGYSNLYFDGVRLHTYGCSNEWEGGRPDGVGTFIHEFSHVMGLPDLYATSYTGAFTPGSWSALDYGPYNNDGMTPPLYSAFERYALGWMKPREVDHPVDAVLQPISDNVAGVIRTSKDTEFFLIENRQQTGWDTFIPGHGMLVWHVDYDEYVWDYNKVNNTPSHQYVDLEEADGSQSEYSRDGDAFPGASNKTSFTSTTKPAMKTWSGQAIDHPLTDIAENDGVITFKISGGGTSALPVVTLDEPQNVEPNSFEAWWGACNSFDHLLSVWKGTATEREYLPGYRNLNMNGQQMCLVTGLEPATTYYYTICLSDGWGMGEEAEPKSVTTPDMTLDYLAPVATEASNVKDNSFTANWTGLKDAEEYLVTVYTKTKGDPLYEVCDFTDGKLPEGWKSSSNNTYAMQSYCGESAPSLRLANNGDRLVTREFPDGMVAFSFWHRGVAAGDTDQVKVFGHTNGSWSEILCENVVNAVGGKVIEINDMPANTTAVRIEFARKGNKGSLAIDDVKAGYAFGMTPVYDPAFTDLSAGNALSLDVAGLLSGTNYYYKVKAIGGGLTSLESNEIGLTTSGEAGIAGTLGDPASPAEYFTIQGVRVARPSASGIYLRRQNGQTVKILVR